MGSKAPKDERLTATRRREIEMVVRTAIAEARQQAQTTVNGYLEHELPRTPLIPAADREVLTRWGISAHALSYEVHKRLPPMPSAGADVAVRLARALTESEARSVFTDIDVMKDKLEAWVTESRLMIMGDGKRAAAPARRR